MTGMTKVAILIDGGFFLKRLRVVRPDVDAGNAKAVADSVGQLIHRHLRQLNEIQQVANPLSLLYRSFYYDARPYDRKAETAIDKRAIDYSKTEQATFRNELFKELRRRPNLALRLGEVRRDSDRAWILKPEPQRRLLRGALAFNDVSDEDFTTRVASEGRGHAGRSGYCNTHAETPGKHRRSRFWRLGFRSRSEARSA